MSNFNHNLLQDVLRLTQKIAYVPPGPPAGAMPPMDPAAMGGAMPPGAMPPGAMPMPPMDPAAMGGAMPPMDPAAMGGAMPPMDPAAMGGAMPPGAAPMDPSMVGMLPPPEGGAPPPPGAEAGMDIQPVVLNMADLQAILAEATGGDAPAAAPEEEVVEPEDPKSVTNKVIESRIDDLENMLAAIMTNMDIPMQEAPAMTEEAPLGPPMPAPEASPLGGTMGAPIGPMEAPIGPMEAPIEMPPEMPKQASQQVTGNDELLGILKQMSTYR